MPRSKKAPNQFAQINFSESYFSLFLGVFVVLIAAFFIFFFAKNKTYYNINTADSTHQEEAVNSPKPQPKIYEVKKGDNLWKIAQDVYGSGYNWVDLAKANNLSNPGILFPGTKLIVPNVPKITVATIQPTQNNGPSISGSSYKIVRGDNLWNISVRKYGNGFKWPKIARINNIQNPDLIYPNNILKLPQ